MRKTFAALLAFASVLALGPAAARSEVTGFGIKAGVAMSNIFGKDVYDQRFRVGFSYGVFMTYGFGRRFAIQPELLYVMKGSKYVNGQGSDAYRETMSLEYVEVPILAKYDLPLFRRFRTHVFAGPAPAMKIRARVDARFAGESQQETLDDVMGVDARPRRPGPGPEIPSGRGRVTVDLRYTAGLTTLSKQAGRRHPQRRGVAPRRVICSRTCRAARTSPSCCRASSGRSPGCRRCAAGCSP